MHEGFGMGGTGEAVHWQLADDHARLVCGPLSGRVEFASVGVHFLPEQFRGQAIDHLSVLFTRGTADIQRLELHEWYVRGRDLIARFEKSPAHKLTPQIDWRAGNCPEHQAASLEVIVSMQTELLDSHPQALVHSFCQGAEVWQARSFEQPHFELLGAADEGREHFAAEGTEQLFVFREPRLGISYAQANHPSDFVATRIVGNAAGGQWSIAATLFPERLEKGVIRRGRICGWFLPSKNDLQVATELARRFVNEKLPLTA
jgi:hypothetical protein